MRDCIGSCGSVNVAAIVFARLLCDDPEPVRAFTLEVSAGIKISHAEGKGYRMRLEVKQQSGRLVFPFWDMPRGSYGPASFGEYRPAWALAILTVES